MVEPVTILAGIKQFGLAPDGADLRDLEAAFADLERQIAELRAERDNARNDEWLAAISAIQYMEANWQQDCRSELQRTALAEAAKDLVNELRHAGPTEYLDVKWKGAQDALAAEADKARLSEALRELRSLFDAKGYLFCSGDYQIEVIARADAALSSSGAGGWRTMDSAPKDRTPVIIAVPTKHKDDYAIGEAYFDPEHYDGGDWWWANTSDSDYYASPISETNLHQPTRWMPLPAAPTGEAK